MLQAARLAALLLAPALAFAQLTANSVTVTATQTATLQPDQTIFWVTVASGFDKSLDDIVAAVPGSGITAANFVGLNSSQVVVVTGAPPGAQPQLRWDFQLPAPISRIKSTTAALSTLAQTIQQNSSGLSLSFSVGGTQASGQQAPACNLADLIASARAQARQLTSAAGVTPGMIQAISTFTGASAPCFLTVRFALGTQLMPSQPDSITVTASRPVAVQFDQISISLGVTSTIDLGLDDITAALEQAGISGAVLAGVNTNAGYVTTAAPNPQPRLQWSFTLAAPVAKIKDTLAAILAAQQSLATASPALILDFFGAGAQISADLAKAQSCPDTDLVSDAKAQAQKVAAAAGVSAGAILSVSQTSQGLALAPANRIAGDFVSAPGFVTSAFVTSVPGLAPGCSMTVAFQLLQ